MNIENAKRIKGWMSDKELELLANWANKFKILAEIGSYHGRSARALVDNTEGIVHCIDPWNGRLFSDLGQFIMEVTDIDYYMFQFHLKDRIKEGKIQIHRKPFQKVKPFDVDLLFIDGDHKYSNCINDIEHGMKFNPKILAGHDYGPDWKGVMRAVDETFSTINLVDTIWYVEL